MPNLLVFRAIHYSLDFIVIVHSAMKLYEIPSMLIKAPVPTEEKHDAVASILNCDDGVLLLTCCAFFVCMSDISSDIIKSDYNT